MKFCVTGITSGVGRRFAEVALERGHAVRGLVRTPDRQDARQLATAGVTLVPGDLADLPALDKLCSGADVMVHMAAQVGDWGDLQHFREVNVIGTASALEAAAKANLKRFVQLSSTAVYGRPERGRVDETWATRLSGDSSYDDTKTEAERLVFRRGPELGIEVTAVRPPLIYGPYDRNFLPRTIDLLKKRMLVLIAGGHKPLNVVAADHLIDVLLLCADHPAAAGEAFNVSDAVAARPPSLREFTQIIAASANLPAPKISLPFGVMLGLGHVLQKAHTLLGKGASPTKPPPITPFVVRIMNLDVIYDSSKAVEKLGWKPHLDSRQELKRLAAAFH